MFLGILNYRQSEIRFVSGAMSHLYMLETYMKTVAEIEEARDDEWKRTHEQFVAGVFEKYESIFEKDLIGHSRTIIDLRKKFEESDYKCDWSAVLHCISVGELNFIEIAKMLVYKFRKLGFKAYYDSSDSVIVEMPS